MVSDSCELYGKHMVGLYFLQFVNSILEELVVVLCTDYIAEYGFVLFHKVNQQYFKQIEIFGAYENEGQLKGLNTRFANRQDSLSAMKKGNEAKQERGTLTNFVYRCWKISDQEHLNSSNPIPKTQEDGQESFRLYSQKAIRRQAYSRTSQCWSNSKSYSHAWTEQREHRDREDDGQKENRRPQIQFDYYDRQEHQISTCSQEDIEIQEKIVRMSHHKQIELNRPMAQQHSQMAERQLEQQIVEMNDENQYDENIGHLVPFGPPNISDLSTNYSINSFRQDIDLLENQPNHIFIENQDNILDHLSQISTRPCMSHLEESNHSQRRTNNRLTDEDYEAIIANAETSRARWQNVNINTVSETAINYISTMIRFLQGRENVPLSLRQREEFWSIMAFMRRVTSLPQAYLQSLKRFIAQFQQSLTNLQQTYWIEYELIKERTECLMAMNSVLRQHRQ